jgi:hypothetical protein
MKKLLLFIMVILAVLTSCNTNQTKYGQGGENACQYVREQMPEQDANIKNIEAIKEDSVLSPLMISFGTSEIYSKRSDYYGGDITIEELHTFTDSMLSVAFDSQRSWIMDKEWNDSLKQLSKYKGSWRRAYLVEVTMKSGAVSQERVCMNEDGITPSTTYSKLKKSLDEFMKAIN